MFVYICVRVCICVWEDILYIGSVDVDLCDAVLVLSPNIILQTSHVKSGQMSLIELK